MTSSNIWQLMEELRQGRTTSLELVETYVQNISAANSKVNAISQLRLDEARREAEASDAARARGQALGALAGIPCTVKEAFHVAGLRSTAGAKHLEDNLVEEDAPVVAKLKHAGAIVLGKTNIPAMTADWQTYNDIFGITRNPWNMDCTAGGSSGGSAVAVASNMTAFDIGSDLCGCLRIPAHFCGVYAHRPSYGLTSVRGHIPGDPASVVEPDLCVSGPLARSARDLTLIMQVMLDPWIEAPEFKPSVDRERPLRVLVWLEAPAHKTDSVMREHIKEMLGRIEPTAHVELVYGAPAEFDLDEIIDLTMVLTGRLMSTASSPIGRMASAVNALGLKLFNSKDKRADYAWSIAKGQIGADRVDRDRAEVNERVNAFFDRFDLLVMPVAPVCAFEHDFRPSNKRTFDVDGRPIAYNELMVWNALASVFGLPSTIIPLGTGDNGLPVGIQAIAKRFNDITSLDFAERVEAVLPASPAPKEFLL
ncbi:amidase [Pseudovibrio denitrificans]|uniref:Amidase n=1 Tax=Pseudovibrio denitrificans TaxID=258256 RepID=A0A1I7DUU2_9HYPH|nr:amidase family protein [Pseudovibrio denitrificans]SFU15448.1 amidase [Pseudovibrio denitrificans]